MRRASKDTLAGRRYLDLQREAKRAVRPTDELIQLYALECFLDRLVHSEFADTFILKGGVLLAALDARRPTRDIDFAVRVFENSTEISLPRLIDGAISVRGYPLEMVLAEKIVTALERGTVNTRWRDFVDIYVLIGRYRIDAQTLQKSMQRVGRFRSVVLTPLRTALAGYAEIAQPRWVAWLRKQRLDNTIPTQFSKVLQSVVSFVDSLIEGDDAPRTWDPVEGKWIGVRG